MVIREFVSAVDSVQANELKKHVLARQGRPARKVRHHVKPTTIAAYVGVFLFILSMVAIGYQPPRRTDSVANAVTPQSLASSATDIAQPSVDQLVATRVAANIAERSELPIARNVAELSISLSVESQLAQADDDVISKPQIIQPSAGSREIRSYTAVAGDTVQKVAVQYGLTDLTIKWANGLASDAIEAGRTIQIPPVNGIIYTAKAGDTAASIASKYGADEQRVILYNDLEGIGAIPAGQKIIIQDGVLPLTERPGYVAPRPVYSAPSTGSTSFSFRGGSVGNRYAFGNCTYYAYDRRAALGRPIGSFWGNASTWASAARSSGYLVNNTPAPGAIAQWNAYSDGWIGYYGHVAVVESVHGDGTITISEMNNSALGGYNRVNSRTIPASSVSNFIH